MSQHTSAKILCSKEIRDQLSKHMQENNVLEKNLEYITMQKQTSLVGNHDRIYMKRNAHKIVTRRYMIY